MTTHDLHIEDRLPAGRAATRVGPELARWLPAILFGVGLGYALLRYVLVKGVPVAHVPLYVANKAFAVTGVALLSATGLALPLARRWHVDGRALRKRLGANACLFVGLHVAVSLAILRPGYFGAFFGADGTLTGRAELAMLLGTAAALAMVVLAAPRWRASLGGTWSHVAFSSSAALWFAALHVFAMGVPGWLAPARWPGYLPPITLLAFVTVVAAAAARRLASARAEGE